MSEGAKTAMYSFDERMRSALESSPVPMGIYQVVDGRVKALVLSDGFCELFEYKSRSEAIEAMHRNLFWNVHPDDVQKVSDLTTAFVEHDEPYNLVCRVRLGDGYRLVHTCGEHITTRSTGQRLAVVWHIDEGTALVDATMKAAYKEALSTGAVYESVLKALSHDYFNLYYVDVDSGAYVEYGSRTEKGLWKADKQGADFFAELEVNAAGLVYEEDLERVRKAFNKERLLAEVKRHGTYIYHYRLWIDEKPTYVSLKATQVPGDSSHIVIGVSNVDSQVKDRMAAERAVEDKRSYLRLKALTGNIIVLYYVDPQSGEYTEFSSTTGFDTLGIDKQGADFFGDTYKNSLATVHPEDQELFHSQITKQNVLAAIEQNGMFELDYRLQSEGLPTHVRFKAAMVEENDTSTLIIGLLDEDARAMRELEYARNLSDAREKAVIDSLTGVKNKHAYVEWEERIDAAIKKGEQEPFAVVVCDINDLKTVNDQFGHKEGDACIKRACAKICKIFKHSPVFRVGGDEFAVILTKGDYECRSKLLDLATAIPLDSSQAKTGDSLAAGMSEYKEGRHSSLLAVFDEADKAMYKRKQFMKSSCHADTNVDTVQVSVEVIPAINTRKCILVADDIAMNREVMGDLLEDDYDIVYASDGVEALEKLHAHKDEIALVLLDLYMPRMTGREVIAEMQIDDDLMSIPVIFLTVDQDAELDCLRIGAMDFIPKPFPDIEIVKARIAKCIELSEDRDLIRHTERDRLTGLLNKEYFFRYVERLDRIHEEDALDALVCDVNRMHFVNEKYGRQFGDHVLHSVGAAIRRLARQTDGIGCREGSDTFLLYCPHQPDYEQLLGEFLADVFDDQKMASKVSLRFGVLYDAGQEPDVEERFVRAKAAADGVKDDPQKIIGTYKYDA